MYRQRRFQLMVILHCYSCHPQQTHNDPECPWLIPFLAAELGRKAIDTLSRSPASVGKLDFHQLDVSDKATVDTFAEWLRQNHGGLDILVNNAGEETEQCYKGCFR